MHPCAESYDKLADLVQQQKIGRNKRIAWGSVAEEWNKQSGVPNCSAGDLEEFYIRMRDGLRKKRRREEAALSMPTKTGNHTRRVVLATAIPRPTAYPTLPPEIVFCATSHHMIESETPSVFSMMLSDVDPRRSLRSPVIENEEPVMQELEHWSS